jgi:anti-sigma regulatory factor (Ser/Thr protein kinase)
MPGPDGGATDPAARPGTGRRGDTAPLRDVFGAPGQQPGTGTTGDQQARHDRRPRPNRPTGQLPRWRLTIGAKLSVLTGSLVAVLIVISMLLIQQVVQTASAYDRLLAGQVHQAELARKTQVEFKKQVQEWKDLLLRGASVIDYDTYWSGFQSQDDRVNKLTVSLLAEVTDPDLRARVIRFRDEHHQLDADYARALTAFKAIDDKNPTVPDRMVRGRDRTPTDILDGVVDRLQQSVDAQVIGQRAANDTRNRVILVAGGLILLALLTGLVVAVLNIVRPIRRLTQEADQTASERLPAAIATIKSLDAGAEPPQLPPFRAGTSDELSDLAHALNGFQDSALRLAVEQHRADRETADMLINLGRRNQNLLGRMLSYVTDLERQEQNPEVLSQLFRLDHATTRIRRNAESMLVLAGANQTRTWSRPVPVIDVVRAALSEIEEYIRVDLHHVEDAAVNGSAVADVVHLIAELVENATHFSPPTTQVTVIGQRVREGYRLRVIDQGVGMTRKELDDANQRIQRSDAGWTDAKLLGLFVVGRLARRRAIQVSLEPSAGRGITATVLLPGLLLGAPADPAGAGDLPSAPARRDQDPVPAAAGPSSYRQRQTGPGGTAAAGPSGSDALIDLTRLDDDRAPLVPAGLPVQWPGEADPAVARQPAPTAGATGTTTPMPPAAPVDVSAPFTPGSSGPLGGSTGAATGRTTNGSRGSTPTVAGGAIPRRIRGAQLPDLGPADEPTIARPDEGPGAPESLRWQLRSFQLDVQAARRAIAGDDDPAAPSTPSRPVTSRSDASRSDATRTDATRPDATRPDATRPDPNRPGPTRPDPTRPDPNRPDPTRPVTPTGRTGRPDPHRKPHPDERPDHHPDQRHGQPEGEE